MSTLYSAGRMERMKTDYTASMKILNCMVLPSCWTDPHAGREAVYPTFHDEAPTLKPFQTWCIISLHLTINLSFTISLWETGKCKQMFSRVLWTHPSKWSNLEECCGTPWICSQVEQKWIPWRPVAYSWCLEEGRVVETEPWICELWQYFQTVMSQLNERIELQVHI